MENQTLINIINGKIELDSFYKWLSGNNIQNISPTLNRAEFALHVLNYIQEETNRFVNAGSNTKNQQDPQSTRSAIEKSNTSQITSSENTNVKTQNKQETEACTRTPFHVINQSSPTKTVTHLLETSPHFFQTQQANINSSGQKLDFCGAYDAKAIECSRERGVRIPTSTPQHHGRYEQWSRSDSSGSVHSNNSSRAQTPVSWGKSNSSSGSHRHSPKKNSPGFSPTSPQYSDSFPGLGSRGRRRTPPSPNFGDFIITKPNSQKNRKRIKPTQLTTIFDQKCGTDSNKGNKFSSSNRPFVPLDVPHTEAQMKSNFEEERSLLKQKRNQTSNISANSSLQTSPVNQINIKILKVRESPDVPKQNNCTNLSNSTKTPTSLPVSSEILVINPDHNLVTCLDKLKRLASVYSACLDKNVVPNIISEMYFIFTMISTSYRTGKVISSSGSNTTVESVSENKDTKTNVNLPCPSEGDGFEESEPSPVKSLVNELSQEEIGDSHVNSISSSNLEEEVQQKKNKSKHVLNSVHNCVKFATIVVEKQIRLIQCLDKQVIKLLIENSRIIDFAPNIIPQLTEILESKEANEANCSSIQNSHPVCSNGPVIYQTDTDSKDNFASQIGFNLFKKQRDAFYEILCEWEKMNMDTQWTTKRFPQRIQHLMSISPEPDNMMHLARLFCAQLISCRENSKDDSELELPGVTKDKLTLLKARFSKPSGDPRPAPQFLAEQQFYLQFLKLAASSTFNTHVADSLIYRISVLDSTSFFVDGLSPEESPTQVKTCISDCCLLAKFLGLVVFASYTATEKLDLPSDNLEAQIHARELTVPPINLLAHLQQALAANRLVVTLPWIVAFLGMMDPVAPLLPSYRPVLQLLAQIHLSLPLPHLSPLTSFLLRSSLGWLFDPTFFPQHVFCSFVTPELLLENSVAKVVDADIQAFVDHALLSKLSPGLVSLRTVLSNTNETKKATRRHITPIPALFTAADIPITSAQTLELQMEESFFNSQSPSFRATVEFIVDRLSSSCIKTICSHVIAPTKEEASTTINKKDKMNKVEQETWVQEWCRKTGEHIETTIAEHCGPRLTSVLSSLLGPDVTESSVELLTAKSICGRRCRVKIITWLNSHFNFIEMFTKLLTGPDTKPAEEPLDTSVEGRNEVEHRDSAKSPPDMIIELQDMLCQCIAGGNALTSEGQVLELVKSMMETLSYRGDLNESAKIMIYKMSIDLSIIQLAHNPQVMTNGVMQSLCQLWNIHPMNDQFMHLISPRNALLLCQGGAQLASQAWNQLSELLVQLMKAKLITPKQLEEQWITLLKHEWPRSLLAIFGACLKLMLEKVKKDPLCSEDPKFVLTLEWIGEISEELAREDFPSEL